MLFVQVLDLFLDLKCVCLRCRARNLTPKPQKRVSATCGPKIPIVPFILFTLLSRTNIWPKCKHNSSNSSWQVNYCHLHVQLGQLLWLITEWLSQFYSSMEWGFCQGLGLEIPASSVPYLPIGIKSISRVAHK